MNVGIADKLLVPWLEGKEYITATDEGEAVGIAGGYYLATGKRANVFMSADGFMNALNPLTSWVIPDGIKMNFVISYGRQEPAHKVASDVLQDLISGLPYEPKKISFKLIEKK